MTNAQYLDKCLWLQKHFKELYNTMGLVDIASSYVQVTDEMFQALFPDGADEERRNGLYVYKRKKYKGVDIISVKKEAV